MPDPRNKARRLTPGSDKPMQIVFAYDKFGADAADETLDDVQEGKISVKTLEKYLYNDDEDDK